MGYFKQLEIANQVEVGDRVPAPIPATAHVANQYGLSSRRWLRHQEREHRDYHRNQLVVAIAVASMVGLVLGFGLGMMG